MKRLSVLGLVVGSLGLLLALESPAQAQTSDHYFGPYELDFFNSQDCGFLIHWVISGEFHENDFYDSAGVLTKAVVTQGHGAIEVTATAKGVTLGGTAPQNYVYIATYNPDDSIATQSFLGVFLQITVPGEGTVLAEVGRYVTDGDGNVLFNAGPKQDSTLDTAEFCAAFG